MEKEKGTLYIPVGVKTHQEYFDGFGKAQLMQAALICLVGGLLDLLAFIITRNIPVCILVILIIIASSIMMCTRDQTNLSVVDQIKNMIHFSRSQKYYSYIALDEWEFKKK